MSEELRYLPSDIWANLSISSSFITVGNTDEMELFERINYIKQKISKISWKWERKGKQKYWKIEKKITVKITIFWKKIKKKT